MEDYKKMYEELTAEFEQYKKESIKWSVQDFLSLNSDVDDAYITPKNAQIALEVLIASHDASVGISFEDVREKFYYFADPIST